MDRKRVSIHANFFKRTKQRDEHHVCHCTMIYSKIGKNTITYEGVFMTNQSNEYEDRNICVLARDRVTSRNKKTILTSF